MVSKPVGSIWTFGLTVVELTLFRVVGIDTSRPPHFDGTNFPYYKARMDCHLEAVDLGVWRVTRDGMKPIKNPEKPTKSDAINVNAEGKEQGRDMQTPVDDFGIFTEVSRSTQAFPSRRWSPSQGIPRKGQAPGRVTPWIASGLPHAQVGLDMPSGKPLSDAPRRLHYQASGQNAAGLVPSGTRWRPHHKCG